MSGFVNNDPAAQAALNAAAEQPDAARITPGYTAGPVQFGRKVSLMLGTPSGRALDFSDLHFGFHIRQNDLQTPNIAEIRIWNVADATVELINKEFTRVVLQAGYPGSYGVIFDGTVKQYRRGRINGADTYLEVAASDGDIAYNFSTVLVTLAAGSSATEVIAACAKALQPFGVSMGKLPANLPDTRLPRGRVLYGMTRDLLREVARLIGCAWSIQHKVVIFIPTEGYLEGDTVELSAATGLIGVPEQTQDGIYMRCLLNPNIGVGRLIWLNNKGVNQARYNLSYTGEVANTLLPKIALDGFYKVLSVDYSGDTRGNPWYCDLVCIAVDSALPISQALRGRVLAPSGGGGNPL